MEANGRADGELDPTKAPVSGPVLGRPGLEAGITDSRMQHHAHQAAVGALHPSQASEAAQA
ncbi:MAG: hypothetical protein VXX85_05900 [Candidatus Margulisiibacteriota bacterium]|nr:hypothetical protein [Candidatus Margulisiibacteriota bacterium]